MNNLLKHPQTNALCIGMFSAFYTMLFFITSGHAELKNVLFYAELSEYTDSFWHFWSVFLSAGRQKYIAMVLLAVTGLVIFLLATRRRKYDEYHMAKLVNGLVVALALTLIAIALLFLLIFCEPVGIIEKLMLFGVIHWVTVVFADLIYVLLCRWR